MNKTVSIILSTLLLVLALPTCAFSGFQPTPSAQSGGFAGPSQTLNTVAEAIRMRDDSKVHLRGNIIQQIGYDTFTFRDATGTITLEIDADKWAGQTITPEDTVSIFGEIDKDWNSVEVEVYRILKE